LMFFGFFQRIGHFFTNPLVTLRPRKLKQVLRTFLNVSFLTNFSNVN
jgi:hypothetical protein